MQSNLCGIATFTCVWYSIAQKLVTRGAGVPSHFTTGDIMFARMLAAIAAACAFVAASPPVNAQAKMLVMKGIAENHPRCESEIESEFRVLPDRVSLHAVGGEFIALYL